MVPTKKKKNQSTVGKKRDNAELKCDAALWSKVRETSWKEEEDDCGNLRKKTLKEEAKGSKKNHEKKKNEEENENSEREWYT